MVSSVVGSLFNPFTPCGTDKHKGLIKLQLVAGSMFNPLTPAVSHGQGSAMHKSGYSHNQLLLTITNTG